MAREAKNHLTIEPTIGGFRMFGYVLGKKVRRWNSDLQVLEAIRDELMAEAAQVDKINCKRPQLTWLSQEQVRDAEALFHEFRKAPRPLADYVRAGIGILGSGEPVLCQFALEQWEIDMRDEQKLFKPTISNNVGSVKRFIAESGAKFLSDISNAMIERFSALSNIRPSRDRKCASMYSKVTRAARIRAWLTFCVKRKMILHSPFEIDMAKLQSQATKLKVRPMILSPSQCEALLRSAIDEFPKFIPFVILTTWCFMRRAEALRCVPEDVKLGNKIPIVELFPRKNGTASYRTVNIPPNILPLLKECITSKLWAEKTEPFFTEASWKLLREKAGIIKLKPINAKGYRAVIHAESHWQENIQRHSGISYLFKTTGDITEVTRQAGNSGDTAFKHYLNIPQEGDAEKFYATTGALKKEVAQTTQNAA